MAEKDINTLAELVAFVNLHGVVVIDFHAT
jgi:hypothetical protein